VSDTSPVSLVCCGVVGAAAVDGSVLERAFVEAIATQGVVTGTAAYVKADLGELPDLLACPA
jgi:phosphoglycolate phosphatase